MRKNLHEHNGHMQIFLFLKQTFSKSLNFFFFLKNKVYTFNNSIEGLLIKGIFNQIGIHDIRWISLNMVKQVGDEKRWLWLDEIEHEFSE